MNAVIYEFPKNGDCKRSTRLRLRRSTRPNSRIASRKRKEQ